MRYDDERLGRLIALLRAAPQAWVKRAQRIPVAEAGVEELARKLEADPIFRRSFDEDPVGATRAAGMTELAAELQLALDELETLAEAEIPEVVAHGGAKPPLRERVRALLLRSAAVRRARDE